MFLVKKFFYRVLDATMLFLFILSPQTIESRRGLFRFMTKETLSKKINQFIYWFDSFFFFNNRSYSCVFAANYIGKKKLEVLLSTEEIQKMICPKRIESFCRTENGDYITFLCNIERHTDSGIIINIWCIAPKKIKIISNPPKSWYFGYLK